VISSHSSAEAAERSTPEILRRIGRSSFKYFRQTRQRLEADRRLYNALVISVLLYGSETWTLLKADERRLEAFHMNCQRRILGIRNWFHFVTNTSVTSQTGKQGLAIRICWRRLSIFDHVRRLPHRKKSLVTVTKYLVPLTKSFGKYLTTNVFCVPYQIIWLQLFGTIYQRVW